MHCPGKQINLAGIKNTSVAKKYNCHEKIAKLHSAYNFAHNMSGAQQPAQGPCQTNAAFRQFDFWLGDWEAFAPSGKKAGDSKIELILDSCVILENWTSTTMGYKGKSFNTFNTTNNKWQQTWVDNTGSVTYYSDGVFTDGKMILTTKNEQQQDGSIKMLRMTFSKLSNDKVRQFGESSVDEGKTWKTDFDLEYRRKK